MDFGPVQIVQFVRLFDLLGDGWVAIVVYGIFAGLLAGFVTTREAKVGLLSSSLLGIAGAVLAFFACRWLGIELDGHGKRFLAAFAGSLLVAIVGGRLLRRKPEPADS
ncbi:GlsB/YeaQ/YmgE family stress response membrane protein [Luteimonas vadosa]|uniref:GlsB/YeaQ/YmgE family stress response membrane protein n=1 Tax=Luteimonas vadosa TaxID=1165507 RepID=A0ABP9DY18_9GAMM